MVNCAQFALLNQIGISRRHSRFKIHFLWQSPISWLGVWANEDLIRNLSLTLEGIAESDAKAIAAQQKSLDSLAEVVLDNRIAFDYVLAERKRLFVLWSTLLVAFK